MGALIEEYITVSRLVKINVPLVVLSGMIHDGLYCCTEKCMVLSKAQTGDLYLQGTADH